MPKSVHTCAKLCKVVPRLWELCRLCSRLLLCDLAHGGKQAVCSLANISATKIVQAAQKDGFVSTVMKPLVFLFIIALFIIGPFACLSSPEFHPL